MGISLLDAVEQTRAMRAGGSEPAPQPGTPKVQSEEAIAQQNQQAMRELQRQMGGL